MRELPLFPLNAVLFPGMPLRLHIFEDRYKQMIGYCRQSGAPFGVVLIRSGQEVGGQAEPYDVGCTAYITQIEMLPEGRMNLTAIGYERFQIQSLRHDLPYLMGVVENYPLVNLSPEQLNQPGRVLRRWMLHYLQLLSKTADTPVDLHQLPADPLKIAYLASYLLQIPADQKQALLAVERAEELLAQLRLLYRREVTLLQLTLQPHPDDEGLFTRN